MRVKGLGVKGLGVRFTQIIEIKARFHPLSPLSLAM